MEKLEYIVNQLKRTFNKKYENYCITRIYHLLNRDDIQIITQQMFRRKDNKIALADLYLPQINMTIEIDEKQHINNKNIDKLRTKEIKEHNKIIKKKYVALGDVISNINLDEERIDVASNDLKQINKRIDEIIVKIKQKIKKNFVPWENCNKSSKDYIKEGTIVVEKNVSLRTIQEVSELFNKGYKATQRCYFTTSEKNERVWCPTLKLEDDDCKMHNFENEISQNGKYIYEISKKNKNIYKDKIDDEIRIVFPKYKDETGSRRYKFKGIYKLNRKLTNKNQKRVWEKIENKINLQKYF